MQTGGRFVQDVERLAGITLGKFGSKFHTLTFSARKGSGALSQLDVTQSYTLQCLDLVENLRHVLEELYCLVDGHIQYIGDALSLVSYFQRLTVVTLAVAYLTWNIDIRQEVHLDGLVSISATRFASATLHVEGESARLVTTDLSLRKTHKQRADIAEHTCVGSWIAARGSADRTLIYIHYLVDILDSLDAVVWHRFLQGTVEMLGEDRLQGFIDQGRFARAADSRYYDELAERELYIHSLQVVAPGSTDGDVFAISFAAMLRNLYCHLAIQILGSDGVGLQHLFRSTLENHFASLSACLRTDIYNPVGSSHHILIMFYNDDGITQVAQFLQTVDESLVVSLMQTDTWLVENVEYIDELTADLGCKTDALAFTT